MDLDLSLTIIMHFTVPIIDKVFSQIESNGKHYLEMDQLSLTLIYSATQGVFWNPQDKQILKLSLVLMIDQDLKE